MSSLVQALKQGQRLLARSDALQAIEALTHCAEEHPDDARVWIQLLRAQLAARQLENGGQTAQRLLERFGEHPPGLLFAGKYFFAARRFDLAQACFERCLERQRENLVCRCYLLLTRWAGARDWRALEELLNSPESSNPDYLCDFAITAEKFLTPAADAPEASAAAPPDGDSGDPALNVAAESAATLAQQPQREPSKASRREQRLVEQSINRAAREFDQRHPQRALERIEQTRRQFPDNPKVQMALAEALFYLRRFAEAAPHFQRTLPPTATPDDGEEQNYLRSLHGYTLMRLGRFEAALSVLNAVRPFGADDYMGFYHRGICLTLMGREGEGRRQLDRAWSEFQYTTKHYCFAWLREELQALCRERLAAVSNDQSPAPVEGAP